MKRSIISALTIVTAALALSACGVGNNSQTSEMVAPVAGVSKTFTGPNGVGTVSVRNAALVYPGPQGYKAGSEATANAWLFNNLPVDQVVVIRHEGQEVKRVTIKPGGYEKSELKLKLNRDLGNQESTPVSFEFVGVVDKPFDLLLPIAPPEAAQPGEKIEYPAQPGEGH